MKYRYFINKSDEARLPTRVLDENASAYLGDAYEETSFSDWWERGIAMDTRSRTVDAAVEAGKMSSFIMEGEELSLVDGEPMEGREQPEIAQEQPVEVAPESVVETPSAE